MKTSDLLTILSDQKAEIERVAYTDFCPREEESQIDIDSNLAQIVIGPSIHFERIR